mgnify:CR=1 FL=1
MHSLVAQLLSPLSNRLKRNEKFVLLISLQHDPPFENYMIVIKKDESLSSFQGWFWLFFWWVRNFCATNWDMNEEEQKKPEFIPPRVISLDSENTKESKKLTAEEQLKKSLLEGTLKTNIRLAPESRITKDNSESQP